MKAPCFIELVSKAFQIKFRKLLVFRNHSYLKERYENAFKFDVSSNLMLQLDIKLTYVWN